MQVLAFVLLFAGALGAAYSYFVYPVILSLLPDRPRDRSRAPEPSTSMTLIVAARNERKRIRAKLEESLELRSACPDLQIIVASDASTDGTDEIVRSFADRGVDLVRPDVHKGKEFAQRAAVAASRGEVLVFTDSGTTILPEGITRLLELFSDPTLGAVSSTDRFIGRDGAVSGEGLYIRYEMWLRELESRKSGLIGLSGSFFATRRRVCELWQSDIPSDFAVAIYSREMGLRSVSDRGVIGLYQDAAGSDREFARKVRTVIRGMSTLARKREVLNPMRYGLFAFQLWSHKIMRYAVPWFVLAYAVGAVLVGSPTLRVIALAPLAGLLALAAVGAALPRSRRSGFVSAAFYFVQVNVAVGLAGIQFLLGRRVTTWVPTER